MADRTKSNIFTTRGQLYVNPTTKTGVTGDALGYTDGGVEVITGEQVIRETLEEYGAATAKRFWGNQDVQLLVTLRQWDAEVLKARFPGQWDAAKNRIQIPGDRVPGDDMANDSVRLILRPDDTTKDPYVYARKATLVGSAGDPMRFKTVESRRLVLVFDLEPDETVASGAADDQYKYRTLVIAKEADWTYGP